MDRKTLLKEFIAEGTRREFAGLKTYGRFDPKTDTRNLSREAIDEAIDILNYCRFLVRKHPQFREKATSVIRLAFAAYVELRKLEKDELELTSTGG